MIRTAHYLLFGGGSTKKIGRRAMWQVWVSGNIHTNFRRGHLKLKRPLGRPGCRWDNNIKVARKRVGWIDM